jgi:antitoxin CptB
MVCVVHADSSGENAAAGSRSLNRLRWRCRRGMHELDTLLMRFVDTQYACASASEQAAFRWLLSLSDPEILGLLTARIPGHDPVLDLVVRRVVSQ